MKAGWWVFHLVGYLADMKADCLVELKVVNLAVKKAGC